MRWTYFATAAILVSGALMPFAPPRPILMGVVVATGVQWWLQRLEH